MTRHRLIAALGVAAALSLAAACGDDTMDPDPGAPGTETELDESDTGSTGGSSSTDPTNRTGGGGGTEGNQMTPGNSTPSTARGAGQTGG